MTPYDLTKTAMDATYKDLSGSSTLPEATTPENLGDGSMLMQENAQFANDAKPQNEVNTSSYQGA
tara:strand:- start:42813 stop:43007 length:195 start_codon:yes stop_codon:yes gene_type:complete